MNRKRGFPSFLAGVAVGAGLVLLQRELFGKDPETHPTQKRINRAFDRALLEARRKGAIPLPDAHRYVIFSDHHRGARNKADDFRQCEQTYLRALDYYESNGYTLIILGDSEELWEEAIPDVIEAYKNVIQSEARFYPDRYLRVHGNHDDPWEDPRLVQQYLHPYFPGLTIHHSLLFEFQDGNELFLAHGHQGTLDSDVLAFLPPLLLPFYRQLQILTGIGRTSPSRDACLRGRHDTQMYRWASKQANLLLIAGHTHRPVFNSLTHLEKLNQELQHLLQSPYEARDDAYERQVQELKATIIEKEGKYPPCEDIIKTKPSYFNTGCCRFKDGDITGIELVDGSLRLIKWGIQADQAERTLFEQARLSDVFAMI